MSEKTVIAVDVGATKTVVARCVVDQSPRMPEPIQLARFATPADGASLVDRIVAAVQQDESRERPISRVGIGAPGPLDAVRGVILDPPNLPGWRNFPLVAALEERLRVPVRLENDANLGALGEARYGTGRSHPSVFYLTISTGIGAGLVLDNRIFPGYRGMAGEVHAIDPGAYFGTETGENVIERASGPGMVRCARRRILAGMPTTLEAETLDTYNLLTALDDGDPVALETVESARDAITGVLVNVLMILAPSIIVLAGGLCTENRWFVDPVREKVRRWTTIPHLRDVPIERASLWDRAVLYGAAVL